MQDRSGSPKFFIWLAVALVVSSTSPHFHPNEFAGSALIASSAGSTSSAGGPNSLSRLDRFSDFELAEDEPSRQAHERSNLSGSDRAKTSPASSPSVASPFVAPDDAHKEHSSKPATEHLTCSICRLDEGSRTLIASPLKAIEITVVALGFFQVQPRDRRAEGARLHPPRAPPLRLHS